MTNIVLLSGVQSYFSPPRKTVPGLLHGSGGHNNSTCLQAWANFYRSRAWQMVLISNTGITQHQWISNCGLLCFDVKRIPDELYQEHQLSLPISDTPRHSYDRGISVIE